LKQNLKLTDIKKQTMKPRLNIVTLGVADLQKSRQFYADAFGWTQANGSDENIVFLNHGGIVLALYPMEGLAEDAGIPAERSGFSGVTLAINTQTREELDALYEKALAAGAKSLIAPRDTFWGGYDCYFADPDGHPWEIAWAPFWEFDEQGSLKM
jgi:catechol 2,3-dioxygenase-like lactoylglutathione lyase family enzyme